MYVWRISSARFAGAQALSGIGAGLAGGRWNPIGQAMAYTADCAALAMLEMLVHLDHAQVPDGLRLLEFELPDDAVDHPERLPKGWSAWPHARATQSFGARWLRDGSSLALRVPSAVAPGHHNLLLNPAHPRIAEVRRVGNRALQLDGRLLGGTSSGLTSPAHNAPARRPGPRRRAWRRPASAA